MHPVDLIRDSSMPVRQKFKFNGVPDQSGVPDAIISPQGKRRNLMSNSFDIYEMVTNLIIERLEKGVIPWQMTWKAETDFPQNLVYKKVYRGFHFWFLLTVADRFGSPFFLTFKQVKELGGHVSRGEKGFPVVFWKLIDKEDKDGSIDRIPFLRYYCSPL